MVKTEEQIRVQLRAEANAAIEELLQWGRSAETPDLTQMEDKVLQLRDRLGQRMLQLMLEGQGRLRPGAGCAGARTGCSRGRRRP